MGFKLYDSIAFLFIRRLLQYRPRFAGRATRTELLVTFLVTLAVLIMIAFLDGLISKSASSAILIPNLITMIPLASVITRRFHDTSRTGWAWFTIVIPYIGAPLFFGLLLWSGTREENIFGPDPRRFRKRSRWWH